MTRQRTRPEVAAAELGVDADPSPSALAWSVAHAVAIECGRSPDDAMAIASRWATVADMVGEAPPEPQPITTVLDTMWGRVRLGIDFGKVTDGTAVAMVAVLDGKPVVTPITLAEYYAAMGEAPPLDTTDALDARVLVAQEPITPVQLAERFPKPELPFTVQHAMTERSIKGLETIRAAQAEPPRDEDEDRTCPQCGDLDCPTGLCRNRV